ncbi:MAG: transporter [Pirellulales bacterium]|nr:transporter [Pirellulales bacterium]
MRICAVCLFCCCLALAGRAIAQGEGADSIETDRDSFTPSTSTTSRGRAIVESSYSFIDNRSVAETHSFPELLVRCGLSDWLELRLGANYEVGGESSAVSGGGAIGFLDSGEIESETKLLYGLKAALANQSGWVPRSAVILQGTTPASGPETATHLTATYVWGWRLAEGWQWDSAFRFATGSAEGDRFHRWAPSTVLKYEFAEAWNAHVEYFGIFTDGRSEEISQSYLSPGVHYLITPDWEAGVRTGWGLGGDAANFFANVGVGYRY